MQKAVLTNKIWHILELLLRFFLYFADTAGIRRIRGFVMSQKFAPEETSHRENWSLYNARSKLLLIYYRFFKPENLLKSLFG